MKIKAFLTLLLLLLTFNSVYAGNWIPVKADNGKVAEINISSLEKQGNIIKYEVKQAKLDDDIIYKMMTNFENKTTAIVNMAIYNGNKQIGFEDFSKQIKFNPIKDGTLNNAVYQVLLFAKDTPALSIQPEVWEKYFNKQQKRIQRNWHPNIMQCSHYPKERAVAYVTLIINKNGEIVHKGYQNFTNTAKKYNDFNNRLKLEVEKAFKKVKFEPLPQEYKGENIVVITKFEYSYKNDAEIQSITFNDNGIGYMECGKNYSALSALGQLLLLPLKIPYYIFIEPFIGK